MRNLLEDRMEENFNPAGYNIAKEDMEESDNFFESKYKVNFDDISSDEEEDDTSPKYICFHKNHSKVIKNCKSCFSH